MAPPKTERSRSGLAAKIRVLLHSGEEADVERASAGVRERDGERRASERERERGGEREVDGQRGRRRSSPRDEKCGAPSASVRLRLLLTAGKTPAKEQADAHMKDTPRRCVTGPRVR